MKIVNKIVEESIETSVSKNEDEKLSTTEKVKQDNNTFIKK